MRRGMYEYLIQESTVSPKPTSVPTWTYVRKTRIELAPERCLAPLVQHAELHYSRQIHWTLLLSIHGGSRLREGTSALTRICTRSILAHCKYFSSAPLCERTRESTSGRYVFLGLTCQVQRHTRHLISALPHTEPQGPSKVRITEGDLRHTLAFTDAPLSCSSAPERGHLSFRRSCPL